jgi:hypothetical protein
MKKSELREARRLAGIEIVTPDYAMPRSRQYIVESRSATAAAIETECGAITAKVDDVEEAKDEKVPEHEMPTKKVKPWVVKANAKSTPLPQLLKKNKDGGVAGEE